MESESRTSEQAKRRNQPVKPEPRRGAEARPGEEGAEEDAVPRAVQDAYVARRVAEHMAASAEASRLYAEVRAAAGVSAQSPFGRYILVGLVMGVLLLVVISALTRGGSGPPAAPGGVPTAPGAVAPAQPAGDHASRPSPANPLPGGSTRRLPG